MKVQKCVLPLWAMCDSLNSVGLGWWWEHGKQGLVSPAWCLCQKSRKIISFSFSPEDRAAQSLLNKLIRSNLVDNTNQVEVLQRDPNSPLYSVKSFEELRLWVFMPVNCCSAPGSPQRSCGNLILYLWFRKTLMYCLFDLFIIQLLLKRHKYEPFTVICPFLPLSVSSTVLFVGIFEMSQIYFL